METKVCPKCAGSGRSPATTDLPVRIAASLLTCRRCGGAGRVVA